MGKALPNKFPARDKNRRIADFGTVVETCSKTAADCPCPGFSVHRADGTALPARCPSLVSATFGGNRNRKILTACVSLSVKDTNEKPPSARWPGKIPPFAPYTTAF
ncbi:hypothetical protein K440107A6_12770 [Lawsonibacter asaccharolyticus]